MAKRETANAVPWLVLEQYKIFDRALTMIVLSRVDR